MYRFAKRIFDIFLAGFALVLLLPLFIPVIIILACTGEHEIFYRQNRIGYRRQPFGIWKFATMVKNSPNIGTGEITLRNDPRVTPFGKFLRMSKINELPQVFNVLTGQMSIVGPRPLMPVSFNLYAPEVQEIIAGHIPGITGIGSVIFRDEERLVSEAADPRSTYEKVIYPYKGRLEMWYSQNASFITDLKIIFLTAWSIIFPKNKLANVFFRDLPKRNF